MIGVFLDTETNGLNAARHRILEIACKIVDLSDGACLDQFQTLIAQPLEVWEKSDQESLKVNGFSYPEISQGMTPRHAAQAIVDLFSKWGVRRKKAVFICQNPSFDRAFFAQLIDPDTQEMLGWPYHWLDLASMHWAMAMTQAKQGNGPLPWAIGCSKDIIASHYKLPGEAKPHRAMNGVDHLLLCYEAVVGFAQVPK